MREGDFLFDVYIQIGHGNLQLVITVKGEVVTLRGVVKDSDILALEALADAIMA